LGKSFTREPLLVIVEQVQAGEQQGLRGLIAQNRPVPDAVVPPHAGRGHEHLPEVELRSKTVAGVHHHEGGSGLASHLHAVQPEFGEQLPRLFGRGLRQYGENLVLE
jgi:hypothetical protein